jgi:hypothetical protein
MKSKWPTVYLSIAGFVIKIVCKPNTDLIYNKRLYRAIINQLKGFVLAKCDQKSDYQINIVYNSALMVDHSKQQVLAPIYRQLGAHALEVSYYSSLDHFNTALFDVINYLLIKHRGFVLHASATLLNGELLVFMGASGSGKSTIVQRLRANTTPLADDHLLIRKIGSHFFAYQSPLIERQQYRRIGSKSFPINRVFILKQSRNYCLENLDPRSPHLLKTVTSFVAQPKLNLADIELQQRALFQSISGFVWKSKLSNCYFGKNSQQLTHLLKTSGIEVNIS